ncbi:MAG TPA: DUF1810 domain-containing protein [Bacteroidia bacterium]|nr:DUF1810 domain-containing protein [Bacteroidia bacterium]
MSDLNRFLEAQQDDYVVALAEIQQGKKRSHWMWYIFPQLEELGISSRAKYYGIKNKEEAMNYLKNEVLGRRLKEISSALLRLNSNDATQVMGEPDDLKLRSCMTLFSVLPDTDPVFQKVLNKFFEGQGDPKTLKFLNKN